MTENTDVEQGNERIDHLTEIFEDINNGSGVVVEQQRESPPVGGGNESDNQDNPDLSDVLADGLDEAVDGADSGRISG